MPTGPGAIVWAYGGPGCGGTSGSPAAAAGASGGLDVAALGPDDRTGPASTQSLAGPLGASPAAVGGSLGRVTVAAPLQAPGTAGGGVAVLQGRSTKPFGSPTVFAGEGPLLSLTRAYLGDVAIATVVAGPAIAVRVERYFSSGFAGARLIPIPAGAVTALTATMDYRSDVLVAWQQNGSIYAHMLRASGRAEPTQRVGPSAPAPQLRALVSDNNHGMIAWESTEALKPSPATTRVYLDLSASGVRFGAPLRLASFGDPQQVCHRFSCLALVRLSTENVMLAWTDVEGGRYAVRGGPAVFAATRAARISGAHAQAVLADLAAGPAGDAVALWESVPSRRDALDGRLGELWAARAFLAHHDRLSLKVPEMLAAAGPNLAPSVAIDPANDRAVAAWLTVNGHASIRYAVGLGGARYAQRTPAGALPPPAGTHWLRWGLAATLAAVVLAFLGLALWRRRHPGRA